MLDWLLAQGCPQAPEPPLHLSSWHPGTPSPAVGVGCPRVGKSCPLAVPGLAFYRVIVFRVT